MTLSLAPPDSTCPTRTMVLASRNQSIISPRWDGRSGHAHRLARHCTTTRPAPHTRSTESQSRQSVVSRARLSASRRRGVGRRRRGRAVGLGRGVGALGQGRGRRGAARRDLCERGDHESHGAVGGIPDDTYVPLTQACVPACMCTRPQHTSSTHPHCPQHTVAADPGCRLSLVVTGRVDRPGWPGLEPSQVASEEKECTRAAGARRGVLEKSAARHDASSCLLHASQLANVRWCQRRQAGGVLSVLLGRGRCPSDTDVGRTYLLDSTSEACMDAVRTATSPLGVHRHLVPRRAGVPRAHCMLCALYRRCEGTTCPVSDADPWRALPCMRMQRVCMLDFFATVAGRVLWRLLTR